MPKQVRHDKRVILNSFQNPALDFDIPLAFGFCHLTLLLIGSSFLLPDFFQFEIVCDDLEAVVTRPPGDATSGMHIGRTDIHILEKRKPIA